MAITENTHTKKIIVEKEVEETIYTSCCDECGKILEQSTSPFYERDDLNGKYYIQIPKWVENEYSEDEIYAFCCKECFMKFITRLIEGA